MENLQAQHYGCQELDSTVAKDINGGFLGLSITNVDGRITVGAQLDTNALLSSVPGLPGTGGGGLPGLGGLSNLLAPVNNLLNGLLGGLLRL
ncbi:hypothetical protein DLD77_08025 [Chitinophaga alhagiae]|uniref:Bacteriocin n=1 Tax=Chitinophaga alhagiae TaxID=2203219 RepID=A0ABN5LV44_9BACT|nr:hypothetical protein [Chitinophaga alhagiae]AWO01645.1 hypothetical protein DLD77_08025 [Chitinophaga alhagiae]